MEKLLTFETKRIIKYEKVNEELIVFREETLVNDRLTSSREDFSTIDIIESLIENEPIPSLSKKLDEQTLYPHLVTNDFFQFLLENPLDLKNTVKAFRNDFIIDKPYTYFTSTQGIDTSVIYITNSLQNAYDANLNIIPHAVYFDEIHAGLHNGKYNIENAFEILSKRTDINWLSGQKIHEVPFYNRSDNYKQFLSFIWKPSLEDFQRYLPHSTKSVVVGLRHKFIIEEIFGIPYEPFVSDEIE